MHNKFDPVVDQWYRHRDKGAMLRVIAVEPAARLVEIQDFDGDIEEMDLDAWRDMDIDLAEAPEDWTGPYDDIGTDDLEHTETAPAPQDWRTSLETLHAEAESAQAESDGQEDSRPIEAYLADEQRNRKEVQ